ncbi:MAG: hypothetical protein ABIS86_00985 [Streptosporangiaceae bacterium]
MSSEDYGRRVRTRRYGPFEVIAGGVTAWFHGPFAVVSLTGEGGIVTVRAAIDNSPAGSDLTALFTAASSGRAACLRRPGHRFQLAVSGLANTPCTPF